MVIRSVQHSSVNMFKEEVENLLKYDRKRTNVLDIGSAMGTFLFAAKPIIKKPSDWTCLNRWPGSLKKIPGLRFIFSSLTNSIFAEKFSLIHMSHVIEHVPNPVEWFRHAKTILEEDGVLVINVPNKYSLAFRLQHVFYKLGLKQQFSSSLEGSDPGSGSFVRAQCKEYAHAA